MAPPPVNKSLGRKRIDMKLVQKKSNRMVTFSKRRISLFGKASELSTLCGAHLAIMVFSPGGKMYSFGHPNVEAIVDRYESRQPIMSSKPNHNPYGLDFMRLAPYKIEKTRKLKTELTGTFERIDMEKTRREMLDTAWESRYLGASSYFWWLTTPIKVMTFKQCEEFTRMLIELKTTLEAEVKIKLSMMMSSNRYEPHYRSFGVAPGLRQGINGFGLFPSNFVTGWIKFGIGPSSNFLPTPTSLIGVCPDHSTGQRGSNNFGALSASDSGNGCSSSTGSGPYSLSLGPYN